jgi:glutathione S-transferase
VVALYHFWSVPEAQRVRLALACKGIDYDDRPLAYHDDETFFELGIARQVPVLQLESGELLTDPLDILWRVDALFPSSTPLVVGRLERSAWQALIAWRLRVDGLLQRLYAPARLAYRDIGSDPATIAAYRAEVQHRFGMSLEALANDRYAGYAQLDAHTGLGALARHLAAERYYVGGQPSVADALLASDLYPLQILDGIALPIDLRYYFRRVEECCGLSLGEGLANPV